jgi:hypothetical protein
MLIADEPRMSDPIESKSDCSVCTDTYNKTNRKRIECPYCSFSSCVSCCERYILSVVQEPHCMNCKKMWQREFTDDRFPKQFINNELKSHREAILFEREKNLLPQTQENIKVLNEQKQIDKKIEELQEQITQLQSQITELEYKRNSLSPYQPVQKKYHNEVMSPCPQANCRGFVENTMKCGICSIRVCHQCHDIDSDDHKCSPENMVSLQLMEKETKRCPNCLVRIFKVSGCDQMWCTYCNIAFDWKTGEKIRGIIHNPHYYEYVEKNSLARQCDENQVNFPSESEIRRTLDEVGCSTEMRYQIIEVYRYMIYHHQVILNRLPTRMDPDGNLDLRIRYLTNEINEEDFKIKLQRRHKDNEKKIEYRDISETYVYLVNDVFRVFLQQKDIDGLIRHVRMVTAQSQQAIQQLNKRYNSCMPTVRMFI